MADMADWQGRVGQEWARKAAALDILLGPVGSAGLDMLGELGGRRVLDLGCGAGATTIELADRGAIATGVDVSEALLDVARTRDEAFRCTFIEGDAATVEFARRFDALYSRCGAMFFAQPAAAFGHLRAAMRPGAELAIVCWRELAENEWARKPLEIAAPLMGDGAALLTSPTGPGPFAWADPAVFQPVLAAANWQNIRWEAVDCMANLGAGDAAHPAERAAEFCLRIGPLASRLKGAEPALLDALRATLISGFEDSVKDNVVNIGTSAWVVRANAP